MNILKRIFILGKKWFSNSLSADEIVTQGTVDGVNSLDFVTLSTDQNLPGKISFENLELTEVLNVSFLSMSKWQLST